jgi:phosphohistidine phosphatase
MDLILWRHAQAQEQQGNADGNGDLNSPLTSRGEKQAQRIAQWLERQLPDGTRILVSPALRCEQTAKALSRKYKIEPGIAPGASTDQLLAAAHWPHSKNAVLLVGHQPQLGQAIAQLLGIAANECVVRRGAVWWLRTRTGDVSNKTTVMTIQSPDML